MARTLTAAVLAELSKRNVRPVIFCQAQFASGTIYVWSGIGSISWNAQTWTGLGQLGKITPIAETTDGTAKGITISLSGIPSALLANALAETGPSTPVTVWVGFLDANGAIIVDPEKRFSGRTDVVRVTEGGETSSISINVESKLIDLGRARERHYTHQDQQIDYPGDNGFIYVNGIQNLSVIWGRAGTPINNLPGIGDSGSSASGGASHGGSSGGGHGGPGGSKPW